MFSEVYMHFFRMRTTILVLLGITPFVATSGLAQVPQQSPTQQQAYIQQKPRANPRRGAQLKQFQGQTMNSAVALPNVPDYSGEQVFMTGMAYPHNQGSPGYFMVFNTRHKPDQVKEWWVNALRMHKWEIGFANDTSVKASDPKNGTVSVQVASVVDVEDQKKVKNMNGSYTIFYSPPATNNKPGKQGE